MSHIYLVLAYNAREAGSCGRAVTFVVGAWTDFEAAESCQTRHAKETPDDTTWIISFPCGACKIQMYTSNIGRVITGPR